MESLENILKITETRLEQCANAAVQNIAARPLTQEEDTSREERLSNVKYLAEWILQHDESQESVIRFVALVGELKSLAPENENQLMERLFISLKSGKVGELGFRSQDLETMDASYLAYRITHNAAPEGSREMLVYSGVGQAVMSSLGLCLLDKEEKLTEKQLAGKSQSLTLKDWIYVASGHGDAKLKQNQSEDIHAIDHFVADYVSEMQEQSKKVKPKVRLVVPELGEELIVRIISNDGLSIRVKVQESGYVQQEGQLVFLKSSVLYHRPEEFLQNLMPGDYIRAHVVDATDYKFSLEKTFVSHIVNDAETNDLGFSCLCQYIDDSSNGAVWMNEGAVPIYTTRPENFKHGDYALVEVDSVQESGMIHGANPMTVDESFDLKEAVKDCVLGFRLPEESIPQTKPEEVCGALDPVLLRLLIRHLFIYQKSQSSVKERCRTLAIARIMAAMVHDEEAEVYMAFVSKYLLGIASFLQGDMAALRSLSLAKPKVCESSSLLLQRQGAIQLLQQWGKCDLESDDMLNEAAIGFQDSYPALSKMARLIRTSNELMSLVSGASVNVLKREIFRLLNLEDDQNLFETEDTFYLGVESSTLEFKESIVFPPGNQMQPNQKLQELNVMKGICAFLNSKTGGTLLLGVTDEGAIKGIATDMKYLKMKNEDTFMRVHVQDVACRKFGKDILRYLTISLAYDNRVVAIKVDPFPYDLVRLESVAYIRVNAESRAMTPQMEARLLHEKRCNNTEQEEKIIQLNEAKKNRVKVRLCNYASSNSGSFSDRVVEAYDILPNEGAIGAIDEKDLRVKVFKIDRIGHVEVTDVPWNHQGLHQNIKTDPFHMTGTSPIHCILRLNMRAYNLLVEEYPMTRSMLVQDKSADDPHWIFDGDVYSIVGIGRFYMGLAQDIEILDAPKLVDYVKDYLGRLPLLK